MPTVVTLLMVSSHSFLIGKFSFPILAHCDAD
jgi:hypothetical protein